MSVTKTNTLTSQQSRWEKLASNSSRDLILKKIAVVFVAIINLAMLGGAAYLVVSYCPLPTPQTILIFSPFILGVLGALSYLKIPACKELSETYRTTSHPTTCIGKGLAYIFFGPLVYVIKQLDWTSYHDPIKANAISSDLKKLPFEQIADKYGKHFDNLVGYGFIDEDQKENLEELYEIYCTVKATRDFWKREGLEESKPAQKAGAKLAALRATWKSLKTIFKAPFPTPPLPELDFSKTKTRIKAKIDYYLSTNPLEIDPGSS